MSTSLEDSLGRILKLAANGNLLLVEGTTVPADAASGYATGCIFLQTDGGSATAVYANIGSATSANFDRMTTFPLDLSYGVGAGETLILVPPDTTSGVAGKIYGRMAVAIPGGSLKYIPLYFPD